LYLMFKATQIVTLLLATIGSVYSQSNATCLDIKLFDTFGDGWSGAMAWLERPSGDLSPAYPTCTENPVYRQVCPDDDGKYYIVVTTDDNELPRHHWEIVWTVSVTNSSDANVTDVYTGGFNTTMVWDYDSATDSWTLVYYSNLWPNTKACEGCGDSEACKPKPKHKKHKKKRSPKKKKGSKKHSKKGKKDEEEDDDEEEVVNMTNITELTPAPKYGPRAVNVAVTMWDEEGDGWWLDDYTGPSWYISEYSNTELYDSGTLCDGSSGVCKLCLGDGPYVFRVTGDMENNATAGNSTSNFTAWDFCGTQGGYGDELHFHIYHGKCYPDLLISKATVCDGQMTTTLVVEGVLAITGIATEFFSTDDAKIVASVLSNEISTLNSDSVNVLSTTLESGSATFSARKLSTYTHYVNFEFTIIAEELGVDGSNSEYVNNIVAALEYSIESKISSGEFLQAVTLMAQQDGVVDMNSVTSIALVSLKLGSVSYNKAKQLPVGIQYDEEEISYASSSSEYDTSSIVMFVGAVGVALAVFGGIVANRMKGYSKLAQESSHGFEVGMTEIDASISNPVLSRKTGSASLEGSL